MPALPRSKSHRPVSGRLAHRPTANPYSRQVRQGSLILAGHADALPPPMHRTPLALQDAPGPAYAAPPLARTHRSKFQGSPSDRLSSTPTCRRTCRSAAKSYSLDGIYRCVELSR